MRAKKGTVLIVDGYNIIYAWPELMQLTDNSLEASRLALNDIMINYAGYSGQLIYVVYDGKGVEDTIEYTGGITICYTRDGETADDYIERMVGDEVLLAREVYVATSDYAEQRIILGRGAHRISSRELHLEVQKMWISFDRFRGPGKPEGGMLGARLPDDVRVVLEKMRRSK